MAKKNYWLVKQEPGAYAWSDLEKDGRTAWTGVRNYQARNNLRAMKQGDLACFYHSGEERQIVGVSRVVREHYPDPTAREGDWACVDLEPVRGLKNPVSLTAIKADPVLKEMALVRNSRLSVCLVTAGQFDGVLRLSGTKL